MLISERFAALPVDSMLGCSSFHGSQSFGARLGGFRPPVSASRSQRTPHPTPITHINLLKLQKGRTDDLASACMHFRRLRPCGTTVEAA